MARLDLPTQLELVREEPFKSGQRFVPQQIFFCGLPPPGRRVIEGKPATAELIIGSGLGLFERQKHQPQTPFDLGFDPNAAVCLAPELRTKRKPLEEAFLQAFQKKAGERLMG